VYVFQQVIVICGIVVVHVCVFVADASSSDSPDNDGGKGDDRLSAGVLADDEEELPVYLWRPGQTTDVVGEWEQHTRVSSAAFCSVTV